MGCCSARNRLARTSSWQEQAIAYQESLLGYSKWQFEHAYRVLQTYLHEEKLNSTEFISFASDLELNLSDIDTLDSPMYRFYRELRGKEMKLEGWKVTIVLVLMCSGQVASKAEALYERFPGVEGGVVTGEGLEEMFKEVFHIAVKALPLLAQAELTIPAQTLSHNDLNAYISRLEAGIGRRVGTIVEVLTQMSKGLSKQDFVSRVVDAKDEVRLGSATEVRMQLY